MSAVLAPLRGVNVWLLSPEQLARVINSVTTSMLNLSFTLVDQTPRKPVPDARVAVVLVSGRRPLIVTVGARPESAGLMAGAMFGCEPSTLDEMMIDDALCEVANVTAGQIKRSLAVDQTLGLPVVVSGRLLVERVPDVCDGVLLRSGPIELSISLHESDTKVEVP